METTVDTIIGRARRITELPGWSKSRLAKMAGMGVNGLVDIDKSTFNPTAETLRKLEPVVAQVELQAIRENGHTNNNTAPSIPDGVEKTA